jgi:tricorn protease-like protein
MSLHIRGQKGGTILKTSGTVKLLNTKTKQTISNFVYPFWHPFGKYMAYSVNNTHQVFHEAKGERVEVGDAASDVIVYDIAKNEAIGSPVLMQDSVFETFPTFSPDGRSLYFCAAKAKKMPVEYKEVKYNLCRVLFDPETEQLATQSIPCLMPRLSGKAWLSHAHRPMENISCSP